MRETIPFLSTLEATMAFKLNINILTDANETTTGRETFNPLLRNVPGHIRRPLLEAHESAIRKGQYSQERLTMLSKTMPMVVKRARAKGDVWTAYAAEQVLACIEFHGHKSK